ncbi:hypothetical protein D3C87_475790 [compost metagenome]
MSIVKLVDGTEVDSASEDWRFECECRYILNLPTLIQRREWLYGRIETNKFTGKTSAVGGLLQRRGADSVKAIEAKMMELWRARQNSPAD